MRRFVREPLVHFALIGLGLFAIDAASSREEPDAPAPVDPVREPIVVDADMRRALEEEWTRTHPAAPTQAELDALVQDYVDDEVLYREGLARGLAENDPEVRTRVASQMAFVLSSRLQVPTPDDAELRRWFEQHADRFAQPERIDFTQVFVAGDDDARAQELLRLLQDGADPNGLGDTFAGGRRFRGRKLEDLRERFGDAFATAIAKQREGEWALLRSAHGRHVVRVDRRTTASTAEFEAARDQVLHAWQEEWREQALQREKEALRSQWEVMIE